MKLSYKGEHGFVVTAENPDESIKDWVTAKLKDALVQEELQFFREVKVAMRKLKPGQKRVLLSKPIRVELDKSADDVSAPAEVSA